MTADPRPALFTLTTGPVNCYPEVLNALGRPVSYDYDPVFQRFYQDLSLKLQRIMGAATVPVILQGEPVLGLEAAAASLVGPGDHVLNLVSGVYGAAYGGWLRPHAASMAELRVDYDRIITPDLLRQALRDHPRTTIVALCHHDTPSGTINPLAELAEVVRDHGALLLVDSVSAYGGTRVDLDPIDMLVTGPNKCLGCPPGLSVLAISARAWDHMKANPAAPRGSILSVLDWENAWQAGAPFPFTPSIAELNGLDAALDRYAAEGPEAVWARHARTAAAMRAGVKAMGLDLWAAEEAFAAPTATAIRLPEGVDETALRDLMQRDYGVVISSGRGETFNRLVRVGHMGPTAWPMYAVVALTALHGAMSRLTARPLRLGAAIEAALAA
ncbi:alanine--glyoxylate aminotransferase family protein [Sinirhodobacter populi]|uniref:Alanine--glyoxylate aminotransferase family protein n=1 Tax=Paenirhodobacter populi TaxID=2306993 RepID=A0A443KM06_9RHOB|nr:alanine--glyoxylate aminotransferase family protein [Sinirhodobacter populi]RWR33795.1 alanine--glyoxylate aminotransferase family protein [Sinirhodobacter populi]